MTVINHYEASLQVRGLLTRFCSSPRSWTLRGVSRQLSLLLHTAIQLIHFLKHLLFLIWKLDDLALI